MAPATAKDFARGSLAWCRATGKRGVIIGHFIQPPALPLVGIDYGDGIVLTDPVQLTDEPIPEWQSDLQPTT